jgi:hypothetical protein
LEKPKRKDRSGWAIAKAIFGAPVFQKPFTGFEIRKGQFRAPKDGGGSNEYRRVGPGKRNLFYEKPLKGCSLC